MTRRDVREEPAGRRQALATTAERVSRAPVGASERVRRRRRQPRPGSPSDATERVRAARWAMTPPMNASPRPIVVGDDVRAS